MWNVTVLSLFPEMFPGTLDFSIAGKALRKNLWSLKTVNIRQFSNNKNGKVDEVPFGGGPGMVINPEVLDKALKSVSKAVGRRIYLSPRGKKFYQEIDHAEHQHLLVHSRPFAWSLNFKGLEGIGFKCFDQLSNRANGAIKFSTTFPNLTHNMSIASPNT